MTSTTEVLRLKLRTAKNFAEERRELLEQAIDNGKEHKVKIMTNKLEIKLDDRDERYIDSLKSIKMVFGIKSGGCLILMGHLSCSYRAPFGGEFIVTKLVKEEKSDFAKMSGVERKVLFCSNPIGNREMKNELEIIKDDPDFVYNFEQFSDFFDIFEYYKALSNELNNNDTYRITRVSEPFRFVPIDEKGVDIDESNAVVNADGVVVGYKLEAYKYDRLRAEMQERTREYIEITILCKDRKNLRKDMNKIKRFANDLYINKYADMDDESAKRAYSFELACVSETDDALVLTGAAYRSDASNKHNASKTRGGRINYAEFEYLHLYDMGQKIKVDSIDESLRLIKQGESGSAAELLKYLIGDVAMPSATKAPRRVNEVKKKYVKGLDPSQKQAFLMAVDGSPVSLIKGPPGTGKTFVINAIVRYITKELGEKVVISSQTHVAIDNVLDKLMENYDLVVPKRITRRRNKYSGEEIDETLFKTWGKNFAEHNKLSGNAALAQAVASDIAKFGGEERFCYSRTVGDSGYSVIGATTTTTAIRGKRGLEVLDGYDWLIIDEVSKCPIPEVLRYLPYVKHIIMVGDDFQLAPMLEFRKEEVKHLKVFDEKKFDELEVVYKESVFDKTLKKAEKSGRLCMLDENYRSVKGVLDTYNPFYDGMLKNKREKVRPKKIEFCGKLKGKNKCDAFFVEVKNGKEITETSPRRSRYNVEELIATECILRDIVENTADAQNVTVSAIFPYSKQLEEFKKRYIALINRARKTFKSFEIDTVDAFQGRETDIVLVGTVVTDQSQRTFLDEFRRINVAMSRARDKLFVFGNSITLSKIEMKSPRGGKRRYFADIIADIRRGGGMLEYNGGVNYEPVGKSEIEVD